jgi:hypothetical protein
VTTSPDDAGNPLRALLLCPRFTGEQWQLPVDEAFGDRALIGWRTERRRVDAGLPSSLARLLAEALCRHSPVTFAKGHHAPAGVSLVPRQWRMGRHFEWNSTRDPDEAAAGIFGDPLFPWERQGQIAFLSPPGHIPVLDERQLALTHDPSMASTLRALSVSGVLLPGVDGDVAGLYAFGGPDSEAYRTELVTCARELAVTVEVLDEPTFARSLAG